MLTIHLVVRNRIAAKGRTVEFSFRPHKFLAVARKIRNDFLPKKIALCLRREIQYK
jgi:hypothetical protein